jgi:hypothetical protein
VIGVIAVVVIALIALITVWRLRRRRAGTVLSVRANGTVSRRRR